MAFLLKIAKKLTGGDDDQEESKTPSKKLNERDLKEREFAQSKVNISNIYNKNENYKPISKSGSVKDSAKRNEQLSKQFRKLVEDSLVCDLDNLKQLAWCGVPQEMRGIVWKIMLEYLPLSKDKRDSVLAKKREEYERMSEFYIKESESSYMSEKERKTFKVIEADVYRTQPDYPLFHVKCVQQMLIRILTIWHMRHPASGYVQGMNDLVTPLLAAFMLDYINIDYDTFNVPNELDKILSVEKLKEIEADTYHCFCKILEGIQDNYTNSQPGTHRSVNKIRELVKRIDNELLEHIESNDINLMQIAIRWVFCLLVREFSLKLAMRLFDTYISDEDGFTTLHVYICLVLLLKWSPKIKKMNFNDMMLFLQSLPTKDWGEDDLTMIISEAYVYKSMFDADNKKLK